MSESLQQQMREVAEQHRAELPDRFDAGSLSYKRLGDIPAGNLVYVPGDGKLEVAMRVARLNGGTPEALVFNYRNRKGEMMHALVPNYANRHCIDWGQKPIVCWHHPLREEVADRSRAPPPGTILLSQDHLAIRTYFGHGAGEAMYFDVKTGQEVEPAEHSTTIAEWSLGVGSVNRVFLPLAGYPIR